MTDALAAWGNYDRDDPFPTFAHVRARGAVHSVTLADGHAAWLIVGYDEARAALNDLRLSKDMHAFATNPTGWRPRSKNASASTPRCPTRRSATPPRT